MDYAIICVLFLFFRNGYEFFHHKTLLDMTKEDLDLLVSSDELNLQNKEEENEEFVVFLGVMRYFFVFFK
jgi:hypothetical protein